MGFAACGRLPGQLAISWVDRGEGEEGLMGSKWLAGLVGAGECA